MQVFYIPLTQAACSLLVASSFRPFPSLQAVSTNVVNHEMLSMLLMLLSKTPMPCSLKFGQFSLRRAQYTCTIAGLVPPTAHNLLPIILSQATGSRVSIPPPFPLDSFIRPEMPPATGANLTGSFQNLLAPVTYGNLCTYVTVLPCPLFWFVCRFDFVGVGLVLNLRRTIAFNHVRV